MQITACINCRFVCWCRWIIESKGGCTKRRIDIEDTIPLSGCWILHDIDDLKGYICMIGRWIVSKSRNFFAWTFLNGWIRHDAPLSLNACSPLPIAVSALYAALRKDLLRLACKL